jgi:hypothetical protein
MLRSRTASAARVVPVLVSLAPASSNNTVVALKVDQYIYRQSICKQCHLHHHGSDYWETSIRMVRLPGHCLACNRKMWSWIGRCLLIALELM